jgi:hypothetical protein
MLSLGKEVVSNYILSRLPNILLGISNPIVHFVVEKILYVFIYKVETSALFYYIDIRTAHQSDEFIKAAQNNKALQMTGTQEQKDEAKKLVISSLRNLAKFTN